MADAFQFIAGLDLGQQKDPAAFALLRRGERPNPLNPVEPEGVYDVLYLRRWPLGTFYPEIVADVCALVRKPPLTDPTLAFDKGGVGYAVYDLFRQAQPACVLKPVVITGGQAWSEKDDGTLHVAKGELASLLVGLYASGRVATGHVAGKDEGNVLASQMAAFKSKITKNLQESFDSERDATGHGDVAMAVALALWVAEHTPFGWDGSMGLAATAREGGNVAHHAPRGVFAEAAPDPWTGAIAGRGFHDDPRED